MHRSRRKRLLSTLGALALGAVWSLGVVAWAADAPKATDTTTAPPTTTPTVKPTDLQKLAEQFATDMNLRGKVLCATGITYSDLGTCVVALEPGITSQPTVLVCTATECTPLTGALPDPAKPATTTTTTTK